jgi:hypothetical protein
MNTASKLLKTFKIIEAVPELINCEMYREVADVAKYNPDGQIRN